MSSKRLIITCQKHENGVINELGYRMDNLNESNHIINYSMGKLPKLIILDLIKVNNFSSIKTLIGSDVIVVANQYLRSDGNENATSDLLDSPECSVVQKPQANVLIKTI